LRGIFVVELLEGKAKKITRRSRSPLQVKKYGMWRPKLIKLRPKDHFHVGSYLAVASADVESAGNVKYLYLLSVYTDSVSPIYYVTSEINETDAGESCSLCTFGKDGYINHGSSHEWADYDAFVAEAIRLVAEKFSIPESELPCLSS
jgi:hypothetical protein